MKKTLEQLFEKSIELGDEDYPHDQKKSKWIGNPPATGEEIEQAQNRLQVDLPEDYKRMLKICNGFPTPSNFVEPTFHRVSEIQYYKDTHLNDAELWNAFDEESGFGELRRNSIVVGGMDDEQQFLLIPPKTAKESWRYWNYANWIPGEEEHDDLKSYFESVIEFLDGLIEENR